MADWHSLDEEEIFQELGTSPEGLSEEESEERLEELGRNEIDTGEEVHPLRIFIGQFTDFLIYLLILAALVSLGIGFFPGHEPEYVDATLIFLILIANGVFGFVQDYRAERAIEALKDLSSPDTTVLRDGEKKVVDSKEVVPGDIVFVDQGDAVPADARVLEGSNLETDESALTGESLQVSKGPGALEEDTPLAERSNMLYMNTTAVTGRGKAVIVETGMETEVGDIAEQITEAEDKETPFQEEVDELGRKIGYGIMAIIAVVAVVQLFFTSASWVSTLLVAITLAVAAVPEGLPAVVTLTLALGSKKMLEKNALVRRLPVVESLGSVDVIVTDKTGTLTEDRMTVRRLWFSGEEYEVTGTGTDTKGKFLKDGDEAGAEELRPLLETGYICNNVEESKEGYRGDPTEIAIEVVAEKGGVESSKERLREIPFSSDRKRMTTINQGESPTAYMKGAPDTVLERCDRVLIDGEVREMTEERKEEILDKVHGFAGDALRVLGFARKEVEDVEADADEIEKDMVFLGLQGMIDPPRDEVEDAVNDCRDAGIRVVMATGDNIETAKAVGEQVGFDPEGAMEGEEIEDMSDEELQEVVEDVEVFARVSPSHKVRILEALQANDNNVAMTGDGVNDAPALKNADVGISMGERGTDVAQQASDMVLQDDNFVTIRDAIAEGRGIFDNIRKFVNYLLSANAGEVLIVFFGIIIGSMMFPETFSTGKEALILTPVMLLWINLVTDGLPALALGTDPKSEGIMDRPPRGSDEAVINHRMMASIVGIGLIMTLTGLPLFFFHATTDLILAQTVLFTFLVVIEMVRIQTIRQRYGLSFFSNKWIAGSIGLSILLQAAVLYTPLNRFFEVVPISSSVILEVGVGFIAFLILNQAMIYLYDIFMGKEADTV
ncbi:MAG: cation-transporting P-type ATPase [Candidatus Nanohaloarchaeota archaeon QJJ-7]|nr:cation-transporting P-type ATPase [Candidatus Nanohaloarchaeota archaeon QJJ-7]